MNPQDQQNPNPLPANAPEAPVSAAPTGPAVMNGSELPKTVIAPTQAPPQEAPADLPVAAHMEGPPPAQTTPPPSNPNAAFSSQPVAPAPTPTPAFGLPAPQAGATPVITQSDMMAAATPKRRLKKPLIIGGGVFAAAVVAVAVLTFTGILSLPFIGGNLKSVTYDNGLGNTYKLKFFADHDIKSANDTSSSDIFSEDGQKALISKAGGSYKHGVALSIYSEEINDSDKEDINKLKDCNLSGYSKAFEASNKHVGKIAMCSIELFGDDYKDLLYIGVFEHNGKAHGVIIASDVDSSTSSNDDEAKKLAQDASLADHQNDLKKILASINPQ